MIYDTKYSVTVPDLCAEGVRPAIEDAPGTRTSRQACTLGMKMRLLWVVSDVRQRQVGAQQHRLLAQAQTLISRRWETDAEFSQRYRYHWRCTRSTIMQIAFLWKDTC